MPIVSLWTDCLFARDRKSDESLGLDLLFTLNRYSFTKDKYLAPAVKKARLRPVRSISPDTLYPFPLFYHIERVAYSYAHNREPSPNSGKGIG